MPDWQGELESLLATLNVSLEGSPPGAQGHRDSDDPQVASLSGAEVTAPLERADSMDPVELAEDTAETLVEVVPVDGEEISAVRSEIEATLREVVTMVRAGRMDRALRDDVVFVLEALTRPQPGRRPRNHKPSGPDDSSTEWNLASAAAVLRFCRIVLRLTNALAREDDL